MTGQFNYKHLLKSQRNEVHQRIAKAGLDPDAFAWGYREWHVPGAETYDCPSLFLKEVPAFDFTFGYTPDVNSLDVLYEDIQSVPTGKHSCIYSPGQDERESSLLLVPWRDVLFEFGTWIDMVKVEYNAPDLWEVDEETRHALTTVPDDANSRFTPEEQNHLNHRLDQLLAAVRQANILQAHQFASFQNFVAESKENGNKFTKKDWQLIFVGGLVQQVMSLALTPDTTRHLLHLAGAALSTMLHMPPLLG